MGNYRLLCSLLFFLFSFFSCICSLFASPPVSPHESNDSLERWNWDWDDSSFVSDMRLLDSFIVRSTSLPRFMQFPGDLATYTNVRYNRVEGLYIGLGSDSRTAIRIDSSLLLNLGFGYGFGSHYWQIFGGVDKRFGNEQRPTVFGLEGHYVTETQDEWKIPGWENSLHAFFAREDYLNYFRRGGWSVHLEQFALDNLSISLRLGQDQYQNLPRNIKWALFGGDKKFRENPAVGEGWVNTSVIAGNYTNMIEKQPLRQGYRIHMQAEIGRRDYSYERYLAEAVWYQPLGRALTFNTRFRLGATIGDAPGSKYFALGGVGTLPGYRLNEFSGNRLALWSTELILNASPFSYKRGISDISLILFADAGASGLTGKEVSPFKIFPKEIEDWKLSVGVALGTRNGGFRIGAAWRTDRSESPNIVVRFSPDF